ncbi:unnamed protein product [Absidia cylindrospora]
MSLNVSDPTIANLYEDVRDDKSETNWAFFDFATGKPDRLQVSGSGSGGFGEFVGHLQPDVAGWGYIFSSYQVYSGALVASVGVMRRAKLSIQIAEVKNVLRNYHIEVPASQLTDLDEQDIMTKLRKASGANYDRQNSNY